MHEGVKMACINVNIDDDCGAFVDEKIRKARKKHKCGECGDEIQPGHSYEHARGLFDGVFFTSKTCRPCLEIRARFFNGWIYGSILDDIYNSLNDLSLTDMDGLSPGAREKIDKVMEWK